MDKPKEQNNSFRFEDNPPYLWKSVRVFISSTFRDFHGERDYLVKFVFPDLRQWCEKWKLRLVDIDLRWGVTAAEVESGKVIDICLEQIDGSRPFFICMLGNRYGWVPEPEAVPVHTRQRYDRLKGKEDYSITHLEIHHAVLEPLKSLDALEDTPHAFFYFRNEKSLPEPETIKEFSDDDRKEYKSAFLESEQKGRDKLNKLKEAVRSHYEQIGKVKGNPSEVEDRIFTYHPVFDPALDNPEDEKLKGRLTKESLNELGNRLKKDLQKAITGQFHERITALSLKQGEDSLENELDYHESFIENRTSLFIGRTGLLKKLHDYVLDFGHLSSSKEVEDMA